LDSKVSSWNRYSGNPVTSSVGYSYTGREIFVGVEGCVKSVKVSG